ncbi:hypothetical protein M8998_07270 [Sphingobacterium sp. lm-10]|uniref:hypothetical protein n=1 Tax=Sphingobacterium sp. lm-10 TaxID=2944904 RepID=UPI00202081FD|nr:hypothetical protein [Sphingobacterium sp. lm-10]MCL7987734.1 hypothetical protein [Sphingobacterium sp. lm-10]
MAEDNTKAGAEANAPASNAQGANEAAATTNASKSKGKAAKYTVLTPFADKDNFGKMYKEGDDVSHFDEDRLASCVKRGLVKKG